MAITVPYMAFLRPRGLPCAASMQRLLNYSTTSRCLAVEVKEDRNLKASRSADPAYPPSSMRSQPRPKESRASRRTSHPVKQRDYPTRQPSHHQPAKRTLIPGLVTPLEDHLCAPNLPYFVNRTKSKELPVYQLKKAGGNKLLTQIRKIDGQIDVLRDELRKYLKVNTDDAVVNPVTQHVVIKGHHRQAVRQFLFERKF